jgi:uncharacterized protein YaiL (DUF2058 family)
MSLRDQFKKANLLSDKDARRLAHEARVERKEKGREQIEQEQAGRLQELGRLQADERERTAREQQQLELQRKQHDEAAAVAAILQDESRKPGPGSARWYFETADGLLPWLELSPRDVQQLNAGMLCVVRTGSAATHDYRLLGTELCRRVARVRPEVVAFAPRGVVP